MTNDKIFYVIASLFNSEFLDEFIANSFNEYSCENSIVEFQSLNYSFISLIMTSPLLIFMYNKSDVYE